MYLQLVVIRFEILKFRLFFVRDHVNNTTEIFIVNYHSSHC